MQTTDTAQRVSPQPTAGPEKLPDIRHIIAVGSGKGGVGKSTVSVIHADAAVQPRVPARPASAFIPSDHHATARS